VLQVLGRRPTSSVPFSEVRGSIEEFLRLRSIDQTLRALEADSQGVYFRPEQEEKQIAPLPLDLPGPGDNEAGSADSDET